MALKKTLAVVAAGAVTALIPAQSALAIDPEAGLKPVTQTVRSTTWGVSTSTQQLAAGQTDAATQTIVGTAVSDAFGLPLGVVMAVGPALGPDQG